MVTAKTEKNSVTDDHIQRQWQKIRKLDLAAMNDGTYTLAITSDSNIGVPNIDLFVSRRMTKEETYQHLTKIYDQMKSCPTSGRQIIQAPDLKDLAGIKRLT